MKLPLRHISIRVPWHDSAWNGTVCGDPTGNASCLVLKEIRDSRKDDVEQSNAGLSIEDPKTLRPACMGERGTFMSPFAFHRAVEHPYASFSPPHEVNEPAQFHQPAFSAATIPFRWMMRDNAWSLADELELDVDANREPMDDWLERNTWVQNNDNQRVLLDTFFSAIEPQRSLCFFYAKQTPLSDEDDRVIVGVGRVTDIGPLVPYDYNDKPGLRSYVWDRAVSHSIRPAGGDGFLLPYHDMLARAAEDDSLDLQQFVAAAPADRRIEFSYAGEHLTHDGALAALLACRESLERWKEHSTVSVDPMLEWIDGRLGELWKLRGPTPGLGAVLAAFGFDRANALAYHVTEATGENESPWPYFDALVEDPSPLPLELAKGFTPVIRNTWRTVLADKPERRALIELLARFELTTEQATRFYRIESREPAGLQFTDAELLANPYLLFELDRSRLDAVSIWTVDRGVFPAAAVRDKHPLPPLSAVDDNLDERRIRGLTVAVLEGSAVDGHTLQPRDRVVHAVAEMPLDPPCPLHSDVMDLAESSFAPVVEIAELADGKPAYQLDRLSKVTSTIRREVTSRARGKRHEVTADWRSLLDAELPPLDPSDAQEERARQEKTGALAELASARFSVLVGPAGTGKTTLLKILVRHPDIARGETLLLAPTGKARVRLQQATGHEAKTLAQFLVLAERYDGETGTFKVTGGPKVEGAKTVVVDESSMLTEEQLASLIDSLKGVERLILVGDPRQLPPIGTGRPFVDIVKYLAPADVEGQFPRLGPGYAELTVHRRHLGEVREDLQLAAWFNGQPLAGGDDEIMSRLLLGEQWPTLRFVEWDGADDLRTKLLETLVEELELEGLDDSKGFAKSIGGTESGEYVYFNRGIGEKAEAWQILSPVRGLTHGVRDVNRLVQGTFRKSFLDWARSRTDKIPRPFGAESVVYGDKVINLVNTRRYKVWPKDDALEYVANGEIGVVVGQFKRKGWKGRPNRLEIEFSSQPDYAYTFFPSEFADEASPLVELAYAITIHKSQGSEFELCFLVLPKESRLLSRELLYTALTRQRRRIVVLHEGPLAEIRKFSSDYYSETGRRLTNLFRPPSPVKLKDRFLEEHLIHRSSKDEPMRSKAEVIIADALAAASVEYEYEVPFIGLDGKTRWPDFTIEHDASGITYLWEHCGMLGVPEYAERWERKLEWYGTQGVRPMEDGGGDRATLIITTDDESGGTNSAEIHRLIGEVF
jgi:hypothetical protein